MERIAHFLVTRSKVVIALTMLTTLTAAVMFVRMDFNADVTTFITSSSDEGRAFVALQEKYGASDPITVLITRKDGGVMTERKGLELVLDVKERLKKVEGVRAVGTLIPDDNPMTGAPFTKETLDAMPDGMLPYLTNTPNAEMMLSDDNKAVLGVIDPGEHEILVGEAVAHVAMPDDADVTFAGNPTVFAKILDDLSWFLLAIPPTVIFLLLLVFTVNIGSRKLAVLAIVPAVMGSIWTFGLIFALGYAVDLVTVIVPIWVIVMGSADGLHFVTHLQEAAARTDDKVEQTRSALREVGVPMILTTVSTVAGFLSMLATGIGPMMQLGVFAACGITFAGIISFFFLPALLSRVGIEPPGPHAVGHRVTGLLEKLAATRVSAALLLVGLAAFIAVFLPQLDVNPDQLFFFKDNHPARTSFAKLSDAFGGATPLMGEFVFDRKGDTHAQLQNLAVTSTELAKLPGIKRVFSLADLADKLPEDALQKALQKALQGDAESPMGKMVSDDGLRFVVFPSDIQPKHMQAWASFVDDHDDVRVLTGQPMLFDAMSRMVMKAQLSSLAYALALVALLLLVVHRNLWRTLTALVPIAVTIAVLLAFLAASGIQLHLMTAIMSSIVIGVGIDYVIHFLAAVEMEATKGDGYGLRAIRHVGRPIVANALGIAVGMSALFLSPLKPHGELSQVMWVSMVVGALTTLVFVPAMLPKAATTPPNDDA